MTTIRKLPNGNTTDNVSEYVYAWEGMAKPIERAFGWKLAAFDPSFAFETAQGDRIQLSPAVVVAMASYIEGVR